MVSRWLSIYLAVAFHFTMKQRQKDYVSTVFRLLFNGKHDTIQNFIDNKYYSKLLSDRSNFSSTSEKENYKSLYKLVNNNRSKFGKTSGWVSNFFDYLYLNRDSFKKNRKQFRKYFPELNNIIETIERKVV
ncbi:hypothetical protein [Oceanobacillus caeni]|uniref:hypothetical protein n=1 Tax=Oceanobacillus caeni TaxID=405946 RepID=UPI002E1D3845|nr:hypothetical protein [Oceanobacillus caeni]